MDDLDHRSLGVNLDLFHVQDSAPGGVFWHPRHAEVGTPQLLPPELRVKSGHREKFGASMFALAARGGADRRRA